MMNLSIIGSGNVGKHFIALVQNSKDLNLIQWLSRSESSYQNIKTTSDFKNIRKADVYVICVTDSERYAEIALSYGASVPFIRDVTNAGDTSPDREWLQEVFGKLDHQNKKFDIFAILRPTSPFRRPETIRRAMGQFLGSKNIDSIRAVEKCSQHPGKMWMRHNDIIYPLMPFIEDGTPWHSRQYAALPEVYIQNASLEICWTKKFLETGQIAGNIVAPFFTENYEGFDLNNEMDWIMAEQIASTNKIKDNDLHKKDKI